MIDPDDAVDPDNEDEEEEEEEEEITRDDLRRHYHDIEDFTRTDFRPGVYRHAADKRFPDSKRGYLPIVAEGYTYTMDVMFINFIIEENTLKKYHKEKLCQVACTRSWTNRRYPPVIGGLILVETTSRRFSFTDFILKILEKFSMLSSYFFLK